MEFIRERIDAAKARLPLPELLVRLGAFEKIPNLGTYPCPLHHEQNGRSFSISCKGGAWLWNCFGACRSGGDEIDFLERRSSASRADAIRQFIELAGGASVQPAARAAARTARVASGGPKLPDDATPGTEDDWRALAALRHLDVLAVATAAKHLGTLYFGTVCGERCWIVTDERRVCAEARRMDGKLFRGNLGARKAHTIGGSLKSWPVGIAPRGFTPADFRALLVVEGGPDYLAALHSTLADKSDCLPVAFLGAGTASTIHADALPSLRGRRAYFYPHHDASGAGSEAVSKWARQFADAGAIVSDDAQFDFGGLRKADGSPVKDLNDCTQIHPDDAAELEGLLP